MTETPAPEPEPESNVRNVEFAQAPPEAPEATVTPDAPVPTGRAGHPAARFAAGEIAPEQRDKMLDSKVRQFPPQDTTPEE